MKLTPLFTSDEMRIFGLEMWAKFRSGVRSAEGMSYIVVTAVGVAWASWGIPAINNSEVSPETLGIYVIGFLISVMLDAALVAWKYKESISKPELAVLAVIGTGGLILAVVSSFLAIRPLDTTLHPPQRLGWRCGATPGLIIILVLTIVMSLIVSGVDSRVPPIGPIDNAVANIADRSS